MKLWHLIVLMAVLAAATISSILILTHEREVFPEGTQKIEYVFMVGEFPGVDAGTDIFRLGQVIPGGSSWRSLSIASTLSSITSEDQLVRSMVVVARGEGSAWLTIEPAIVEIPGNVTITLNAPPDAKYGEYRGFLAVIPYE